jgi:hypothetical protein
MTKRCLQLLFLIGISASFAFGQVAITGAIRGVVTDASGGVLPQVSIIVEGPAIMTPRKATTDVAGNYLFDSLPTGAYKLTYTISGYKTEVRSNVEITPGFTATVSPQLSVGVSQQSVVVEANSVVVDTTNNTTATTFDDALLQNVPSGRDTFSTVAQAPGVASSDFDIAGSQSFQQSVMQVHGSLPGDQVYSFNGLRMNWPGSTGGYTSFYIDDDSLSALQVVTDSAPAEVAVGGVYMNMVPKSGSNQMHGLAALYYQSAGTQATISDPIYDGTAVPSGTPFIMARDVATNLGAPLLKDKWWVFGSWRLYDLKESVLSVTNPDGTATTDPNHQSNTTLRTDYAINTNNRVDFVWWFNEQNRFFRRDTSYAFVDTDASWRQIEPAYILQGEWNSTVHSSLLFDTRFGYLHQIFPLENQADVPVTALNRQDVTLSTESGAPPYSFVNPASDIAFAEGASWYDGHLWGGAHTFKFGVDTSTNHNGYNYTADMGINALYNNGTPIEVVAYNTPVDVRSIYHETAVYAQDSVTLKRKLTLNLGVRYDHFDTFYPKQSSPPATFPGLFPQRTFPQSPNIATWNTFRPRLGAAYDLTGKGKSVIRAYFGQFDILEGAGLAEQVNPNGLSTQVYKWTDANGDGIPQNSEWDSPADLISAGGGAVTTVDKNLKRPYTNEVNVGYEQQVFSSMMVGVNYYFRNIKDQFAGENLANPASDYTATTTDPDVLSASYGDPYINPITGKPITLYNLNQADVGLSNYVITNIPELDTNHYNGVELTATKRMSKGWQVLAGYTIQQQKGTYSRGLGDDFNNPNNEINRKNAVLNYDATQMFKILSNYTLPKSISLGINYQHYTGYPLDPNNGPPTAVFEDLNQGQVSVIGDPIGDIRLPNVNIVNLRMSRPTHLGERFTLEPIADLFNIGNANTVISEVPTGGSSFEKPSNQLNPFIARFALRFSF